MQLTISNNSVQNPQTVDLSNYPNVQQGEGMDMSDPAFTSRIFTRSLLKEGASLSLTQYVEKELTIPLELNATSTSALMTLIEQINDIIDTPGATASWTPDGASQATVFDLLSGNLEIQYDFRREQQHWTKANLRLFAQPFGRTASPRLYATASGVGPLLMISPYASGGGQVIGASTQAGVAGYGGGNPGGVPSGGVFYWGSPSLAGDAPAQLQISYVGPLPNGASGFGPMPYTLVSVLPDANYVPLIGASQFIMNDTVSQRWINDSAAVASTYSTAVHHHGFSFFPLPGASPGALPPLSWAGDHRLLVIARASGLPPDPFIANAANFFGLLVQGPLQPIPATASFNRGLDWGLYDLGTFTLRASEAVSQNIVVSAFSASCAIDVTAVVMLPDNKTWFLSPNSVSPSQYGTPSIAGLGTRLAPWTNTILVDDVIGDQFIYQGASQTSAPSPLGAMPSAAVVTPFTRGLVPRPDPKAGLPIIAILGMSRPAVASNSLIAGASWANPQNLRTMAQVNVLERTRYVLP